MQTQELQTKPNLYSTLLLLYSATLFSCFTHALLMLYSCVTHALLMRYSTVTDADAHDKDMLNVKALILNLPHEAERRKSSHRMVLL